jgi:hypothetical protein
MIFYIITGGIVDIARLEKQIELSKWILMAVIGVTIAFYAWNFNGSFSSDRAVWGQFGDYLGGVMNPLMAFGAFYWLATSVLLQKKELSDTRDALVASQKAQQQQAETALAAAKIQALNIRLSLTASKFIHCQAESRILGERLKSSILFYGGGEHSECVAISAQLDSCRQKIKTLEAHETDLITLVEAIADSIDS